MQVKFELMSCVDCLMYVANGDLPEDDNGELQARIATMLTPEEQSNLCVGDSDQDDEFSWRACECCGSPLSGSRHQLICLEA